MELIWTEHKGPCENQELDYQGAGAFEYKSCLILSAMVCDTVLVSVILD